MASRHPFDEVLQGHLEDRKRNIVDCDLSHTPVTESTFWGRKQKDNRDVAINFRATSKDKTTWTEKADSENITLSALIRNTMNMVHDPESRPIEPSSINA
tara:strand:- start:1011 stop:1310 length:300 start_codon:yes stop_codon:yes gene_type:complete